MKSSQAFRILIVEDNAAWFRKKEPILEDVRESEFEFEHVPSLLAGLQKLADQKYHALEDMAWKYRGKAEPFFIQTGPWSRRNLAGQLYGL